MQQAWLLRELIVCRCLASDDCLYSLDIIAASLLTTTTQSWCMHVLRASNATF